MSEVKWIKITTNIFDDEKIKIIDTMPARDEILVIWFKLLALAGKSNQNGMLFISDKVAYTPEMLSAVFNRKKPSIELAISTFEQFGMIEIEDNQVITISNWDKHQNIDGLDKIREQNKLRQKKHRANKNKLLGNVTRHVTVTQGNAIEVELDKEIDIEEDKHTKEMVEIEKQMFIDFWNMYDKKKDKEKCEKKFHKLTYNEIGLILLHLPEYVLSTPDKQYRKNPLTYLNGKCWNDEIVQRSNSNGKKVNEVSDQYKEHF